MDRFDRYEHLAYEYPQAAFDMTKLAQLKGAQTLPQLARVLGVKPESLSYVLYWTPPEQKYETFDIPQKGWWMAYHYRAEIAAKDGSNKAG